MNSLITNSPIWAEINLEAIRHNLNTVKQLASNSKVMAVVKADAYGHGIEKVAQTLSASGVNYFGVARLSEAVRLRENNISDPILILGYTPVEAAAELIKYNLTQTVFSSDYAELLNEKARESNQSIKVHIKIDTGMGRLGLSHDCLTSGNEKSIAQSAVEIAQLSNLEAEGIYTHFAASDAADKTSANQQLNIFQNITSLIEEKDITFSLKHAANSAAVIDLPESYLDMVRPGIMLYGLYPSLEVKQRKVNLKPVMQLKARIAQIKKVPKGFKVSYGHTYTTAKATSLATIPLGYADGYRREFSSLGTVLVGDQKARIVGRVCMDQSVVDVGHIQNVSNGDEVVIIGQQGSSCISAEKMAHDLGTINYEVVSSVMARVPRVFSGE